MEQISLKATLRDKTGKQVVKKMRREGSVPAVVYHRGEEAVVITVSDKEISRIIREHSGENILINLKIEKDKRSGARAVIIKEVQHDPIRRNVLHVDFNEISLTEKITVDVELIGTGTPIGVKQDGGSLDHTVRILHVQCLPTDIPKNITVDVSNLALNQSIHVKDLVLDKKIKVLNDPELLLFQVKLREEKVEYATATPQEVEVMREKKEDDAKAGAPKEEAKKDAGKDKK